VTHTLRKTQIPGPRSKTLFDLEALYLAPGTQSVALFSRLAIERGEGAVLYDVDGNSYIDLLAGVGVALPPSTARRSSSCSRSSRPET